MGLFRLINKDVAFENETRQGVVTLRLLYIIQAVVVVLDVFFAGLLLFFLFRGLYRYWDGRAAYRIIMW